MRNITCLLLPSHDCAAEAVCLFVFFFNQDTAFYTVGARHSHDMCLTACFVYDKRA